MTKTMIMYTTIALAVLLASCAVDPVDSSDPEVTLDETTQEVGSGTAAGQVACWTPATPSKTCAVTINGSSGGRCSWNVSVALGAGFCGSSTPTGYGQTRCDGPEDCFTGFNCCANSVGGVVTTSCQTGQCNPSEPTYDPLHVRMCHADADCLWPWRHCLPSGAPNHAGLPPQLGICK
jgi:hypothetical protein